MSAFMVGKAHIDAMVAAGLKPSRVQGEQLMWNTLADEEMAQLDWKQWGNFRRRLTYDNASDVGQMLWAENLNSIHYRYPGTVMHTDAIPGPNDFTPGDVVAYRYNAVAVSLAVRTSIDPVKMLTKEFVSRLTC